MLVIFHIAIYQTVVMSDLLAEYFIFMECTWGVHCVWRCVVRGSAVETVVRPVLCEDVSWVAVLLRLWSGVVWRCVVSGSAVETVVWCCVKCGWQIWCECLALRQYKTQQKLRHTSELRWLNARGLTCSYDFHVSDVACKYLYYVMQSCLVFTRLVVCVTGLMVFSLTCPLFADVRFI